MPKHPKYSKPEDMQEAIIAYFAGCEDKYLKDKEGELVFDKLGRPIVLKANPPTITGLALALGFTSRQALLNYQAKRAFVDTITRAKAMVEEYAESRLFDRDGQRGAEFSLRSNFRWRDEAERDDADGLRVTIHAARPAAVVDAEPEAADAGN